MKSSHAAVKLSRRDRFIQTNSEPHFRHPLPEREVGRVQQQQSAPRRDEKNHFYRLCFHKFIFRGKKTRLPLVMSPGEPAAQQPTGKNE